MHNQRKFAWALISTTTSLIFFEIPPGLTDVQPPTANLELSQQVTAVVNHLVGVMDTTAQAAANPKAPSVRMTTCKVRVINSAPDPDSIYLYQEQALTNKLNQPYRQRFLQIHPGADGKTIESKSFKPEQLEALAGLCRKSESDRLVTLQNLGVAVCSVFLQPTAQGFEGETPTGGCPAKVRGAVRITNRVTLHGQGMDTWDRGYDDRGRQVWGAADQSYQYRWVSR